MKNWKRFQTDQKFQQTMRTRSVILSAIRSFFSSQDFLEVETPTLVKLSGMEPNLDPFVTELSRNDRALFEGFLITSPEYSLKKLLAAGVPKVFEITKCFRNSEPWDGAHNPEFTMIEWYRAHVGYETLMEDLENLVSSLAMNIHKTHLIIYNGQTINVAPPWQRMTVAEAFNRYTGIDLGRGIDDHAWFRSVVEEKGCIISDDDTFDDIFFKIFLRDIEPKLGVDGPVILYEYPRSMASLAQLKPTDQRFAERFEAYCGGMELCNTFSELNDAHEQRRRLEEDRELRIKLGKKDYVLDEQFLEAVALMPKSAGIALGIDRLVMLLTDSPTIKDVLFFPAGDLFT